MNILWQSNSPQTPSGYGVQTALFTPMLAQDHNVTIFAYYGIEGAPGRYQNMRLLPRGDDAWGNDVVAAHMHGTKSDLLITLMDAWVLNPQIYGRLNWLAWVPVDHEPVPPRVAEVLRACRYPVAMSQMGQALLAEAGIIADYAPHGVDTDIFRRVDRAAARRKLGWQDGRFVAMMNAANKGDPGRKSLREVLEAWRLFICDEPDALLYIHTDAIGRQGVPLLDLVEMLGLQDSVRFPDPYRYDMGLIGPQMLNAAYNAADVLLNPSRGEGFGVPILEAQAAGCPVIVSDFTAMRELCFAGWKVRGVPEMTYQNAYQLLPSIDDIHAALKVAKKAQGDETLRWRAAKSAALYDYRLVYAEYWRPILAQDCRRAA